MRILCSGDLHLGRRSTRLRTSGDPAAFSAAAVWSAIVDHAIAQRVDMVALSGDLVDQENRFFEALGPLERGLRRLGAEGIVTVAVAGNHDWDVLPALARQLDPATFRLVGVGGRWERTTVSSRDGLRAVHVDGWSFASRHVRENPLATYDLAPATDAPVLGLLHCDLAPGSVYAPVTLGDLRARHPAMWLVGHIHVPMLHHAAGASPVLYPGSPQPLQPNETGAHGAWMVELFPGTVPTPRQVPLATARYASVDVDVSDAGDREAVRALVVDHARREAETMVADGGGTLRHVSLRMRLVGACARSRADLEDDVREIELLDLSVGGVGVQAERVDVATRVPRDLDAIASGTDAAAVLARLVRDAGAELDGAEQAELRRALFATPGVLRQAKPYRALGDDPDTLSELALREVLGEQASALLDALIAQRPAVGH